MLFRSKVMSGTMALTDHQEREAHKEIQGREAFLVPPVPMVIEDLKVFKGTEVIKVILVHVDFKASLVSWVYPARTEAGGRRDIKVRTS